MIFEKLNHCFIIIIHYKLKKSLLLFIMLVGKNYPILEPKDFWATVDCRYFFQESERYILDRANFVERHKEINMWAIAVPGYAKCLARGDCKAPCLPTSDGKVRHLCSEHGSLLNPINDLYHDVSRLMFNMVRQVRECRREEDANYKIMHRIKIMHGLVNQEISLRRMLGTHYKSVDMIHDRQIKQCWLYSRLFEFLMEEKNSEYLTKNWGYMDRIDKQAPLVWDIIPTWEDTRDINDLHSRIKSYLDNSNRRI